MRRLFSAAAIFLAAGTLLWANDRQEEVDRVRESKAVFEEIMQVPDEAIPQELLAKAYCIGIVPSMKRGGFIVGGRYGKGVLLCREPKGLGWTGPSTVRIEGGSFGFQIGGAAVDVVMLVMNKRGAEKLMSSRFTFGGDATVAAGPVGRSVEAETDALLHAQILSYSRSRGIFAGVSLEGATLRPDDDDNAILYGKRVSHRDILTGKTKPPSEAEGLIHALNKYSARETS